MKKTVVITGAYGVIGRAIAEMMAENDYALILVGKDKLQLAETSAEVARQSHTYDVKYVAVDLSSEKAIKEFADSLEEPVHVLINNAATTPLQRIETSEGIEMQWAVNVLAYMWMMMYLRPHIVKNGRIVNVASFYAGSLDLNDVEFKKRGYDNDTAYRQSKQANRMLSAFYAEQFKPYEITVNSCHPGEISSKLSNSLGFHFPDPPRKGADTPVWLATSKELEGVTGQYFQYRKNIRCQFSQNKNKLKELYELCQSYTKYTFDN